MTPSWHISPDCRVETSDGLCCPRCVQNSLTHASIVRKEVRQARERRGWDRYWRFRSAQVRQWERRQFDWRNNRIEEDGRFALLVPDVVSTPLPEELLHRVWGAGEARYAPPARRDTRIYVWGCGRIESRLLRERGQLTPAARQFARERGWDEYESGAWALELAMPAPLSGALAALDPVIRREPFVVGYGGRTVRTVPAGGWGQPLPKSAGATVLPDDAAPPSDGRADGDEAPARSNEIEAPGDGATLRRSEQLQLRMNAAVAHSRTLSTSAAATVAQCRALRSQLREKRGAWNGAVAGAQPLPASERFDVSRPLGVADRPEEPGLSLPDSEFAALNEVISHAHELATSGCLSAGYTVLLAGRHRAEHAVASGEEWAPQLVGIYHLALENYIFRYGAKL